MIPQCSGRTATIFVNEAIGLIFGGIDSGMLYAGRLRGTPGRDIIVGTAGPDIMDGKGGNDLVCGGAGNDTIRGGAGDDRLFGQAGVDLLNGGAGSDRCEGDPAEDTFTSCERIISCRISGCVVPVTCNLETQCDSKVDLFVNVKSIRRNDITASQAQRRIKFTATAVASVLPFETVSIRPKLTKRGKRILRANSNKKIKGRLVITDAITGALLSNAPVSIELRSPVR